MSVLYLTENDVRELLPMTDCIGLMRSVFERLASGEAANHPRRRLTLPTGSTLHYMAGSDGKYFGAKVYATHPKHGAYFLFLLYRESDAAPLAVMEANHLGQIRTGAASGLATQILAREDADTLGIIGSGFQARTQLEAMLAVRKIKHVRVWSRNAAKREKFATEMSAQCGVDVRAVDAAEEAVRGAAILVTATYAKEPVLSSEWVDAGTHVNAMGSNQAARREIPGELVHRAHRIVVDSIEQARMESGDLLMAYQDGDWASPHLVELSSVAAGNAPGRTSADQITLFKSNGLAAEDAISAGWVYERAIETGRGSALRGAYS